MKTFLKHNSRFQLSKSKLRTMCLHAESYIWFSTISPNSHGGWSPNFHVRYLMIDHTKHSLWPFCQLYQSCVIPLRKDMNSLDLAGIVCWPISLNALQDASLFKHDLDVFSFGFINVKKKKVIRFRSVDQMHCVVSV